MSSLKFIRNHEIVQRHDSRNLTVFWLIDMVSLMSRQIFKNELALVSRSRDGLNNICFSFLRVGHRLRCLSPLNEFRSPTMVVFLVQLRGSRTYFERGWYILSLL